MSHVPGAHLKIFSEDETDLGLCACQVAAGAVGEAGRGREEKSRGPESSGGSFPRDPGISCTPEVLPRGVTCASLLCFPSCFQVCRLFGSQLAGFSWAAQQYVTAGGVRSDAQT